MRPIRDLYAHERPSFGSEAGDYGIRQLDKRLLRCEANPATRSTTLSSFFGTSRLLHLVKQFIKFSGQHTRLEIAIRRAVG